MVCYSVCVCVCVCIYIHTLIKGFQAIEKVIRKRRE